METVNFRFSADVHALVGMHRKQVFVENATDLQGLRNLLGMLYPDLMPYAEQLVVECEGNDCGEAPHEGAVAILVSLRNTSIV